MNVTKHTMDNYKRFLLQRTTNAPHFTETLENLLASEDDAANYCFHKIMIHSWTGELPVLFDLLSEYFSVALLPVWVTKNNDTISFYTSSLTFITRLISLDFMFPHQRATYNIDVLFNDKTSMEFFSENLTIEDVVSMVVSNRYSEEKELDLSNICEDQEFLDRKIYFYRVNLIANFKLLMLRIGKDTKSLNLSNNKLTHPPLDIMNFFVKGDLTEVNLSYNLIESISHLVRMSSKIEKLWLEGNPLCEQNDATNYVKQILVKFPRLVQLDGIIVKDGVIRQYNKNYISESTPHSTKLIVDRFLFLYFTHYDTGVRKKLIEGFYDDNSMLTIAHPFIVSYEKKFKRYMKYGRNVLTNSPSYKSKRYKGPMITSILNLLPATIHDPTSFTVDVIKPGAQLIVIVDGLFKQIKGENDDDEETLHFRRTFVLNAYKLDMATAYHIQNELFTINYPSRELLQHGFRQPTINLNVLTLVEPGPEEIDMLTKIFCSITQLKKEVAETRLRTAHWDIKQALAMFKSNLNKNMISAEQFIEEDDFSDSSSLIDDEMF